MKKLFENWNTYLNENVFAGGTRVVKGPAEPQQKQQPDPNDPFAGGTRVVAQPQDQNKTAAIAKSVAASIQELEKVLQALKGSLQEARLNFSDLIVHTGNLEQGITGAYKDVCEGVKSETPGPIKVNWIEEEQKFLVVDGLHRLVEFIEDGEKSCYCEIDWNSGSDGWLLPNKQERFENFSLEELKRSMNGLAT